MAKIADILKAVRNFSPENATQPDFEDNVGLLVGSESGETDTALACLDVTERVVIEADKIGAKLILSHHPVIYRPHLSAVTDSTSTGRAVMSALKRGISIYCAHTNLDFCKGGINDYNAELIGLQSITPLEVINGVEIGRVGTLARTASLAELTRHMRAVFCDPYARCAGNLDRIIKKVAVINGGAGNIDYIQKAIRMCADCYISADFPHHALIYAKECGISLIHMQHYSMEHIYIKKWTEILMDLLSGSGVKITASAAETNPTVTEAL